MTVRDVLNSWADYKNAPYGGHINFGFNGNNHIRQCMDHEAYAYIRNKYTCILFSHTTRNKPMCYALITHDVDLIPFTWVRLRAFRIEWLDGLKFVDKWKSRTDMQDRYFTPDFKSISRNMKNSMLAEFTFDSIDKTNELPWREKEVVLDDGKTCRIFRKPDGKLEFRASAWWKEHNRCWPVQRPFSVDAGYVIKNYENESHNVNGRLSKELLEEVKMQMVVEQI